MTALQHDAQGFLVGTPIDLTAAAKTFGEIRNDVRAIRQALIGTSPNRVGPVSSGGRSAANEARRQSNNPAVALPGQSGRNSPAIASARQAAERKAISETVRRSVAVAIPKRDSDGRFVKGSGNGGDSGSRLNNGLIGRLSRTLANAGGGLEEADPAAKAFQEVAQPMARGYELLTGGNEDKKQTGFLRRIFSTLNIFRKEETALNKATNKSLKAIEDKPVSTGGTSGGLSSLFGTGGIGGVLSKIPLIGPLLAKGGGLLGGLFKRGGGLLAKGGGLFKRLGKGAFKKLPFIGALLGGAMAWNESSAADEDTSLTGDERRGARGKGWGGAAGGLVGGAVGFALAGPVGAIVGSVVGDWLGGQGGEIIGMHWQQSADYISEKWDVCVDFFKETWTSIGAKWGAVTDWAKSTWGTVKDAAASAGTAVKERYNALKQNKTVGPVLEKAEAVAKKTAELASNAGSAVKDIAVAAGTAVKDATVKGADYVAKNTVIGRAATAAGKWVLGQTSRLFESGKGGAGTVSTGKGDHGAVSYGTYQLSSKMGEVQKFLGQSGYGSQFAGLEVGSKAFNDKWKEVAKNDPAFATAQHDYIKSTKFDPQMARLKKSGMDLSGRGAAVQDAIWSTSVQFGGNTGLIKKALAGKDVSKMSDAEIVSAIQDYKLANNDLLFKSSAASVRASTANRAKDEKAKLVHLATQDMPGVASLSMPTASASAGAPSVPSSPSMPSVSDSPPVVDPMASTGGRPVVAVTASQDVTQDLRERNMAHIVTGGMSA